MARYRVILAGGDRTHQEQYARQFGESGRCELVAVTDAPDVPDARHASNRALAKRFCVPYLPFDQALGFPCDIVSVCAGMADRPLLAARFAALGRHLYLDKPLAPSLAEARAIADAVRLAQVKTQIFSQVTTSWAQALKAEFFAAGPDIHSLHARMLVAKGQPTNLPGRVRAERLAIPPIPPEPVKREMFDLGYYPIALLEWVVDRPVRFVSALTANHFFDQHLAANVEDFGTMLLEFEGGILASIVCGRTGWESHPGRGYIEATLLSRRGQARFSPDAEQLLVRTAPERVRLAVASDPMGMWDSTLIAIPQPPQRPIDIFPDDPDCDVTAFLDHLDCGTTPEIDVKRGVRHLAVLETAYRSASGAGIRCAVEHGESQ